MDRRFKIFYINENILKAFLNWKHVEYITLPVFQQLPEDATIQQVHYSYKRHAFGIIVYSETFDVIKDGDKIPEVNGLLTLETIKLPKGD